MSRDSDKGYRDGKKGDGRSISGGYDYHVGYSQGERERQLRQMQRPDRGWTRPWKSTVWSNIIKFCVVLPAMFYFSFWAVSGDQPGYHPSQLSSFELFVVCAVLVVLL